MEGENHLPFRLNPRNVINGLFQNGKYAEQPLVWVLQHPQFLKVWVLAPMVFGKFFHIATNFHKNDTKNAMNPVIP